MNPLRLLMLINTCQYGGAERYTVTLAVGLKERGVDVCVACPDKGKLNEVLSENDIKIFPLTLGLKIGRYRGMEMYFPRVFRTAPKLLRDSLESIQIKHKFHVIHFQFLMEKFYGTRVARDMKIPVVWTNHGGLPSWYRVNRRLINLYRESGNLTHKIVCVSRAAEKFETGNIGIDPSKTCVIHNGIDLEPFLDAGVKNNKLLKDLNLSRDNFIVGMICQVYRQKGHDDLVKAVEFAKNQIPRLKCLVVGDGPYLKTLKKNVERRHLERFFCFTGFRRDIPVLTGLCDIIVSLSRSKSEGLPLRLIEAMACGAPVVATDVGGTSELFTDGRDGWILPPGRPILHALKWIELSSRPECLKQSGIFAREKTLKCFGKEIMLDKTLEVIRTAASQTKFS